MVPFRESLIAALLEALITALSAYHIFNRNSPLVRIRQVLRNSIARYNEFEKIFNFIFISTRFIKSRPRYPSILGVWVRLTFKCVSMFTKCFVARIIAIFLKNGHIPYWKIRPYFAAPLSVPRGRSNRTSRTRSARRIRFQTKLKN